MDYEEITTLLMFGACETIKCISVAILYDNIPDDCEIFSASLERIPNLNPKITIDPDETAVKITEPQL